MLRLRDSGLWLALLLCACGRKEDPEPLAGYGAERLGIYRSTDIQGTPIFYAYLFPHDTDGCPPLADVRAEIDGRTLAVNPGGGPGTCFGASFKAPLVVLSHGTDFHELSIEDDTKAIRARVADLRSDAKLAAQQDGDVVRLQFDHAFRGRIDSAMVTWSGTVPGDVAFDGDTIIAPIPVVITRSGRLVVKVDAMIDLEIAACEGIADCEATWFFHEVLDVSLTR
jgi:hypothetical protein